MRQSGVPTYIPRRLDRALASLSGLSPSLLAAAVSSALGGELEQRVALLRDWSNALTRGVTLTAPEWFSPVQKHFFERELLLPFAGLARDNQEMAEQFAVDLMKSVEFSDAAYASRIARALKVRSSRQAISHQAFPRSANRDVIGGRLFRRRRSALALRQVLGEASQFQCAWHRQVEAWLSLKSVFGSLGVAMGVGQGLADGVLKHAGWADFAKMAQWLEQVPQVAQLVSLLGRMNDTSAGESVTEKVLNPVRRIEEYREMVRIPRLPEEIRGVERSGEIARMLPYESMLLLRPKLKLLWHARRAEEALSTYLVEGTETRRREREVEVVIEEEQTKPRPNRGPVIAVVDTSGSMHGQPEYIAKALVLAMLSLAHREGRRCYLYGFSGPSNVTGMELTLDDVGLPRLMDFLRWSFHGGTDPSGVLTQVVDRLRTEDWKQADVLVVSDGEFSASHLSSKVAVEKASGTRFHGVMVGRADSRAMATICDPVHHYAAWMAMAPHR